MIVKHPILVVGVPAYNEERFIAETIQSLKAQSWEDFSVLVADNASTDRTGEECFAAIAGDSRFHYLRHASNIGAVGNFNSILDNSESPYFMWLGAHDMIAPEFIRDHLRALDSRPECSLSYSLTQWVDQVERPLRITNPSEINTIAGRPLTRYLRSIAQIGDCTAINNVLRRSSLGDCRLSYSTGSDKAVLSTLLYRGPANLVPKAQYIRRDIKHGGGEYMETMTGQAGARVDRRQATALYWSEFRKLESRAGWFARARVRLMLERHVARSFSPRFLARAVRRGVAALSCRFSARN